MSSIRKSLFLTISLLCGIIPASNSMAIYTTFNKWQAMSRTAVSVSHNMHLIRPGYQLSLQQHPTIPAWGQLIEHYFGTKLKHDLASPQVTARIKKVFANNGVHETDEHPIYVVKMKYQPWRSSSLGIKVTNHYVFVDEESPFLDFSNVDDAVTNYLLGFAAQEFNNGGFLTSHCTSVVYYTGLGYLQHKISQCLLGALASGWNAYAPDAPDAPEYAPSPLVSTAKIVGGIGAVIGVSVAVNKLCGYVDRPVRSIANDIYFSELGSKVSCNPQEVLNGLLAVIPSCLHYQQLRLGRMHVGVLQARVKTADAK